MIDRGEEMKVIISCTGMPQDKLKEIEDELNNPNSEQTYFIFDKPVTVSTVLEEPVGFK